MYCVSVYSSVKLILRPYRPYTYMCCSACAHDEYSSKGTVPFVVMTSVVWVVVSTITIADTSAPSHHPHLVVPPLPRCL